MKNLQLIIAIFTISFLFQACAKQTKQITNESLTLRKVSIFDDKDIYLPKINNKIKK